MASVAAAQASSGAGSSESSVAAEAPKKHLAVRVEDGTSQGRSYSTGARKKKGLGAERRALRTKTFSVEDPVVRSLPASYVHLSRASREEILEYFRNTWALNDTLFSALRDDSVFYMIPDKLRRPLIFYFAHPAALYINKMHVAGLVGELHLCAGIESFPTPVQRALRGELQVFCP